MKNQRPFNVSRFQFIRHPISLFLNSHGSQSYRNGLLSYPQWFCKLLWLWSSSSNASNSLSSNFFGCPRLVFNAEISILETSKQFPTWFISWSSVTINSTIQWASAALFFQLKQKIKIFRKCCLVNTKFDISNTVKINFCMKLKAI